MSIWEKNGGIYLGFGTEKLRGDPQPMSARSWRYTGDRGIITVGPSGSGKTHRILKANLANLKDWTVICTDPKADLAVICAEERDPGLKNTVFLNPFNVRNLGSTGYNPIAALDPTSEDFPDDAMALAEAIIRVEGREPHFSAAAQDLVCALIMAERIGKDQFASFANIRRILGLRYVPFTEAVKAMQRLAEEEDCEELQTKISRYAEVNAETRELNSIISTALTQTRWLDSRPVKRDLAKNWTVDEDGTKSAKPQIDFRTLKDRPQTIYLILPAQRMRTHNVWMRLMIASILQPLLKEAQAGATPILLMCDEWPLLAKGGFPVVEENVPVFRGYGIKFWSVWQDLNQARTLLGDGWETFAANAGLLQCFAPQDVFTAKYISDRSGLTTIEMPKGGSSFSFKPGEQVSHGESVSNDIQIVPRLLPQELRLMGPGFSVNFSHDFPTDVQLTYMDYTAPGLEHLEALNPTRRP